MRSKMWLTAAGPPPSPRASSSFASWCPIRRTPPPWPVSPAATPADPGRIEVSSAGPNVIFDGKHQFTVRDGQHTYVYTEAP